MKATRYAALFTLTALVITLSGCGGLGKMEKHIEELGAKAEPDPLIVHGDMIEIDITGTFPQKYFHKKVVVEATPVLTYDNGETAFKMKGFQGEDAAGNFEVVPYLKSSSFSYNDRIPYTPDMDVSELELRISGSKGSQSATFDPLPVAKGVITTAYLVQSDDQPIMGEDDFQRTLSFTQDAVINYEYNSSVVRSKELRDDDIKAMNDFIKMAADDESIALKGTDVESYASPEGEISLNENLAQERAETANKVVATQLKKRKIAPESESFYKNSPKGEDWIGFKQKMEASSIEDKNLILRVLEMYSDVNRREQEIKNLAATYREIQDEILPQLRRSQISLMYDKVGYSDEEITQLSKTNPDTLTVEEILYAATLTEDLDEKLRIYQEAERVYPGDFRGINNAGVVYMMQNKASDAAAQFNKAYEVNADPLVANNLGIISRLNGDREKAMEYLDEAAGAGSQVNYNKGIIQIQNGDYASAISNMGGSNSFNLALAQVLNGDSSGAKSTLENSGDDSAIADYLRAIVAARMGDGTGVTSNITSAISKDGTLRDKAKNDLEFRDFSDSFTF